MTDNLKSISYSRLPLSQPLSDHDEDASLKDVLIHNNDHQQDLFGLHNGSTRKEQGTILIKQSIPVVISFFLSVGGTFINLVFAGQYVHKSGDPSAVFAGVSLANMFANVSCLSILIGMSSAVETLASQHNGAGNYKEVGIVLQRSCLILAVITLPLILLWFYTSDIFLALGVEDDVCEVIQNFLRIRSLTIPIDIINESYEKYLMAIGVVRPPMWANISFNLFILFFDLIFVLGLHWPYEWLAWSWVLSMYLSAAIQILLSLSYPEVQRTLLLSFHPAACSDWWIFIQLGLPGTIILCSEWWAYEILILFASLLSTVDVAAQSILLQTASLLFMIPLGIGVVTTSLIGNALGAGLFPLAKAIGSTSLTFVCLCQTFLACLLWLAGSFFIDLFTKDTAVKTVANEAIPYLAVFIFLDGMTAMYASILRGTGKQYLGAILNVIAFYLIGLPLAYVSCFVFHGGVNGLLVGICIGLVVDCVVLGWGMIVYEEYLYSITPSTSSSSSNNNSNSNNNNNSRSLRTEDEEAHAVSALPTSSSSATSSSLQSTAASSVTIEMPPTAMSAGAGNTTNTVWTHMFGGRNQVHKYHGLPCMEGDEETVEMIGGNNNGGSYHHPTVSSPSTATSANRMQRSKEKEEENRKGKEEGAKFTIL